MSIQTHFSEKSSDPEPYSEPKNMTTIELNKNGYFAEDVKNVTTESKKKLTSYTIVKSLIMGTGLFVLMGLCVTILILMINRGSSRHTAFNESSPMEETTFEILFSNKDQISTCKTTKSYEDCCYIFFKSTNFKNFEKCTVQKVLNLFLQYEIEANKRSKRQSYGSDDRNNYYENPMYSPQYYQENNYDPGAYDVEYPNNVNGFPDNNNNYQYSGDPNINEHQNNNPYYQDPSNYQTEYPKYFYEDPASFNKERQALPHVTLSTTTNLIPTQKRKTDDKTLVELGGTRKYTKKTRFQTKTAVTEAATLSSSTLLPKTCPDDNCPTLVNASTKIANITNINAESGQIKISLNDTKIQLSSELRNNPRVSQGSDFDIKAENDAQNGAQNRQVSPCFYSPFASNGFNPSPVYGMVPLNPNFQQQPLYMMNPPLFPSGPQQFQGFNLNQNPQIFNKNAMQVGGGGQYYMCRPVSSPSANNVAGLPAVEIRRMSEAFTLQDLLEGMPRPSKNNQTREAIDCPFGTHPCGDNSKCIHDRQLCDNEVNCQDASDEIDCSCKNRVGELRWCDGYLDCPNGEDESNCFDCGSDELSCDDWSRFQRGTCVPQSQRCDGIKQCEITGKDEEDCSILTDRLGQHSFYKVSNAAGFLHRNYKGKWYPTCFGSDMFAADLCKTEAGPTGIIPSSHLITTNDNYPGPFLDFSPNDGITFAETCMRNKAAFVECPPMFCGLRLTITNPFRNAEVDTSAEEFLSRRSFTKSMNNPIIGDSRVVGGKASQPTAWPWVVSIYKNGVFHCGGVLINELWILTAAHCVDRFWLFYYEIQAGILRRFSYSPMEQTRWATMAISHENYSKRSLKNDIALMKLSKSVRFNRYVRPICLPSEATAGVDYLKGPKPNTVCVTVGWGATVEHGSDPDHLREVEIPILPHCKHTEDEEGDEICAGLLEGGRDACQGDSGGPLMCQSGKNRSQWYLAGIVSHGEGCARPDEPGVYTKVSKYIGWINENINGKSIGRTPLQTCPGYICTGTQKCIPKKRHCDRIVDCLFGDDELNCLQSYDHSNFRSMIVGSRRSLLDNLLDILESSEEEEEQDVIEKVTTKSKEESKNETATFLDIKSDLNVTKDKIVVSTNFVCRNMLQTIPFNEKCDKVIQCEDGSDEVDCSCVDLLEKYHKEAICDGVTDCKDMSDESNCEKCLKSEHLCRISQKCIPSAKRCDGRTDCINAEDEWDCVALTDGRTLVFDSDLRPKQSMKGIITINRFGVWRPLCTNGSVDNEASIAANVCDLLGFEEYTLFHQLSVPDMPLNLTIEGFELDHSSLEETPLCGGLFVRCSNISLVDTHKRHRDKFTNEVELYTAPWNAVIYMDGKFRCTGTILNPHWIITVRTCFQQKFQIDAYIAVLLGKGKAHLDVEGPHEQLILINDMALVEESNAIVLRTKEKINFSRYIKPARITTKSRFIKEQCVAIGFQDKKMKMEILESKKECTVGFRCFDISMPTCEKNKSELWNGVITCNSRESWYPAAIYENIKGPCNFAGHKFPKINNVKINLAMGNDLQTIPPKECKGFRCPLGECIRNTTICDGVLNCRSGGDEDRDLCLNWKNQCHLSSSCSNLPPCKPSQFRCKNGECIPKTSFCDTINDCKDDYDEPEECSCRTYMKTVHPGKICDGTVNCWDRSDEKNCKCQFPTNITCGRTDRCISKEMLCDGFRDCPDGDDEKQCFSLKTNLRSINSGEVLKRTAGVWHSGCFTRNHTKSELEEICQRLGFVVSNARLVMPPKGITNSTMKPVIDRFDVVRFRRGKNGLQLRLRTGNEPYLKFIQEPNCYRLFIECIM